MLEEGGDLYVCLVTVLWLGWIYVLAGGILNVVWWILLWILVPAGGGIPSFVWWILLWLGWILVLAGDGS